MNHRLTALVLGTLCGVTPLLAEETLPPLKDGIVPQSLDELWAGFDPRAEPLDVEVLKEWEEEGVVLKVLRYRIGTFKGKTAMMAAVYGYPKEGAYLPGLVQIHGGGQYAHANACRTNAKRGYATLSISWAGRIDAPDYRVTPNEVKLFWDNQTDDPNYKLTTDWGALDAYHAPSRNGKDAFVSIPTEEWTLDAVESPRNNSWFLCTLAARRALTFLEQQPEVNGNRLGVYGHSMGGKLTVLTAGNDERVKAAAPSCGGISDRTNTNELFRNTLGDDASLKRTTCPIVFLSPANDFHGRINNLPAAVQEIQSRDWRATCSPHHSHQDTPAYEVATQLWFDQYLKGTFEWPQTPSTELTLETASGTPSFSVMPDANRPVAAVEVYYTQQGQTDGLRDNRDNTENRFWHHVTARNEDGRWIADLPVFSADMPLWVYANCTYELDAPITGAGYYYGSYTTETYNLSSLVEMVLPQALQLAGVQAMLLPERLIENFEGDWMQDWFSYRPNTWAISTHKVYHPQWTAPAGAALSLTVRAAEANTFCIALDDYAAEVKVMGGSKSQTIELAPSDFTDIDGDALADWSSIMELRFSEQETLRARGSKTARKVGTAWTGAAPVFENLKWTE